MIVDQYARNEMKLCFASINLKRFTPSTNNSLSYFKKSLHIFMPPPIALCKRSTRFSFLPALYNTIVLQY